MLSGKLVRLIEVHQQEITDRLLRDIHRYPDLTHLRQLPEAELRGIVRESIAETGAASVKDLGQVMKATMAKVGARADGKRVSALVREELGA